MTPKKEAETNTQWWVKTLIGTAGVGAIISALFVFFNRGGRHNGSTNNTTSYGDLSPAISATGSNSPVSVSYTLVQNTQPKARRMTTEALSKLREKLAATPKPKIGIQVKAVATDNEAMVFAEELSMALRACQLPSSVVQVFASPLSYPKGISIIDQHQPQPSPEVVRGLREALKSAGFEVNSETTNSDADERWVCILIGPH